MGARNRRRRRSPQREVRVDIFAGRNACTLFDPVLYFFDKSQGSPDLHGGPCAKTRPNPGPQCIRHNAGA